jgi:hypothetical protein
MSNLVTRETPELAAQAQEAINALVLKGDTSKLTLEQKTQYYSAVCSTVGLNPATRPFQFLTFQGKEVLYPDKSCAEQLRSLKAISLSGPKITFQDTLIMVEVTATMRNGRTDTDYGIVDTTTNLNKGLSRGDAILKAVTKAKRRVTFSICGLGFLNDVSDAREDGSPLQLEDLSLAQLHDVEYLSSNDFAALTEYALAVGMTKDAWGHYLMSRYPGRGRGEIPKADFDLINADLSNEKIVSQWIERVNPSKPIT